MATIANLMSEYTPLYRSLPQENPQENYKDRYDRMVDYIDRVRSIDLEEQPEDTVEEPGVREILARPDIPIQQDTVQRPEYKISNKPKDVMDRAVRVANYLYEHGDFSKDQAAAIVGVMIDENNVDPTSYMKAEKAGKGAKGTGGFGYGAGIGSWTFADTKNALLKAGGYKPNTPIESLSLDEQANLLVLDSNGRMKRYYDALRRTNNIEDASATAVLITGGVGHSKNWLTHPTVAEAKALSDFYGRSNDRRFGKSPYHWDLDKRRLEYARRVRYLMG